MKASKFESFISEYKDLVRKHGVILSAFEDDLIASRIDVEDTDTFDGILNQVDVFHDFFNAVDSAAFLIEVKFDDEISVSEDVFYSLLETVKKEIPYAKSFDNEFNRWVLKNGEDLPKYINEELARKVNKQIKRYCLYHKSINITFKYQAQV